MKNEELKQELKEDLKLNKRQKVMVACGVGLAALLGYKAGFKKCDRLYVTGLSACCAVDPELKDRFMNSIIKLKSGALK